MLNPLDGGDRYSDGVCDTDVRDTLWWLGELGGETGECCIPGGGWREGYRIGALSWDQKSAITPSSS